MKKIILSILFLTLCGASFSYTNIQLKGIWHRKDHARNSETIYYFNGKGLYVTRYIYHNPAEKFMSGKQMGIYKVKGRILTFRNLRFGTTFTFHIKRLTAKYLVIKSIGGWYSNGKKVYSRRKTYPYFTYTRIK